MRPLEIQCFVLMPGESLASDLEILHCISPRPPSFLTSFLRLGWVPFPDHFVAGRRNGSKNDVEIYGFVFWKKNVTQRFKNFVFY